MIASQHAGAMVLSYHNRAGIAKTIWSRADINLAFILALAGAAQGWHCRRRVLAGERWRPFSPDLKKEGKARRKALPTIVTVSDWAGKRVDLH